MPLKCKCKRATEKEKERERERKTKTVKKRGRERKEREETMDAIKPHKGASLAPLSTRAKIVLSPVKTQSV